MSAGHGLKIVVLGLSLSSSWGNGHATTYRALLKALAARGHSILFLERERSWYRENQDLAAPDWCRLAWYHTVEQLKEWRTEISTADAVVVGSYVPDGISVGEYVQRTARGVTAFYDIDTPVTLAALDRGDCTYLTPDLIAGYDLYLSFTGGPTLERVEKQHGSPAARALYCSVDTGLYRPQDVRKRWDLSYLGTYSDDRQPVLERLLLEPARRLPHLRFVVAGPQYPASVEWPSNVERIDHVGPGDHPAFYGASRWTLNVTRADMVRAGYSPSVRLFEAAACATPIISDRWEGLQTIFMDGRSIRLAQTPEDVIGILAQPDASRIGVAAQQVIMSQHSAAHRAAELETHVLAAMRDRHRTTRAAGAAS